MTRTVAAIDCGTNSIRLLVASLGADGRLVDKDRRLELVRLGQGVDATHRFAPEALDRTFAACEQFAGVIEQSGCDQVWFAATSAARDVANRDEFFAGVRDRLGIEPEVIPGELEARLSFVGALSGVPEVVDPVLVIDIGGGSTELVLGRDREVQQAVSLDMGSVRITERYLHDQPPTSEQKAEARAFVGSLLGGSGVDLASVRTFIGVAGTATSLSAIHQGLKTYDRDRVNGSHLSRTDIVGLAHRLLGATPEQIERGTCLPMKRAEVVGAGALICAEIARRTGAHELLVSENDILDGMAMVMLGLIER